MSVSFRSSTSRRNTLKVLAWGVTNAGKSYLGYSAPKPAVLNWENRRPPGPFAQADFPEIVPANTRECLEAFALIESGKVPCESVVLDSLQKPYDAFVQHYSSETTGKNNQRGTVVDYVAVNRAMLTVISPLCALPDVNVIAIARQGVQMDRNGNDFRSSGIKLVGNKSRWEYEFDYVLHYAGRGSIKVEKSVSDHLPVGSIIRGDMDWDRLVRLDRGEETLPDRVPPTREEQRAIPATDPVAQDVNHRGETAAKLNAALARLTGAQRDELRGLTKARSVAPSRLLLLIRTIAGDRPLPPALFGNLLEAVERVQVPA